VIPAEISSPCSCQKLGSAASWATRSGTSATCETAGAIAANLTKTVFLDALGTLVDLEPPWVGLRAALGDEVDEERLVGAVKAEMAYYREHSDEGRDPASLADLRERCAAVLSERLGQTVSAATLVEAIRFDAYADAEPALARLREQGLSLWCVSNWDISLEQVLGRIGLDEKLDGVLTSAEAGARKPDPAIFARALERAGCRPEEALHVGDTPEEDLAGAEAAGIRALLINRDGGGDIASLEEIAELL
jgi:putative hydrolase of the HAD superfamily